MYKLMVVDDNPVVVEALCMALEGCYEIHTAYSGEACLEALRSYLPDVVLLDYQMAGLNGGQILERLQGLPWPPSVVLLSAHMDVDLALRAMKLGAADCLQKPCDLHSLRQRVAAAAQRRHAQRFPDQPFALRAVENLLHWSNPSANQGLDYGSRVNEFQRQLLREALAVCQGDPQRAAERLGLNRQEFHSLVENTFREPLFAVA